MQKLQWAFVKLLRKANFGGSPPKPSNSQTDKKERYYLYEIIEIEKLKLLRLAAKVANKYHDLLCSSCGREKK
ncbi:hypothetical protein COLO4_36004 [Corchorus olitorius]|uniref:Uncharacterized protein n=1 Tax=Corchorus olitorius TaxID=93759 RepID=A0A1R3GBG3_9ROSI|nr:hypothetical protein COLO4_36004 [Corchorus olitorius]